MEIVLKCTTCDEPLDCFTDEAEQGVVYVSVQPCRTCMTREFHEWPDDESIPEGERSRINV